jgi:bacterioferritin (cytochrome b1)
MHLRACEPSAGWSGQESRKTSPNIIVRSQIQFFVGKMTDYINTTITQDMQDDVDGLLEALGPKAIDNLLAVCPTSDLAAVRSQHKHSELCQRFEKMSDEVFKEYAKQLLHANDVIDYMLGIGYVPYCYNRRGGRRMSGAVNVILKRIMELETAVYPDGKINTAVFRARIISLLGNDARDKYSSPVFDFVSIEHQCGIEIDTFDDSASLYFCDLKYAGSKAKMTIADHSITNDEKVEVISGLFKEVYTNTIVSYCYACQQFEFNVLLK